MENLSLYRKYRPVRFEDVIGQDHITKTLKNQIKSGKINHSYLFCGSRGIGKTTVARIFAKAINCTNTADGEPCLNCEVCKILSNENLDVVEIDAASNNRVDEIRELREKVKFPPINTKKKVYIIDEVHMLSDSAFNALLKTLEEPPKDVVFILATTEPQKLPATILSRCVRFDFKLLSIDELCRLLKGVFADAGITSDEASIKLIADVAQGSARDLLSIADMCASFCSNNLTYEKTLEVLGAIDKNVLIDFNSGIITSNISKVFEIYNGLTTSGKSVGLIIKEMLSFYRDLTIIKSCAGAKQMLALPKNIFERMKNMAGEFSNEKIVSMLDELAKLEINIKNSLSGGLLFEAFLIKQTLGGASQNVAPKQEALKEVQPAPSLDKKSSESFARVFGKLLTELKNNGYMALYGVLSEITTGKIENGFLIGYLADSTSEKLLEKEENKNIINAIINNVLSEGLKFKVQVKEKQVKDEFSALEVLLGDKFKVE